MAPVRILRRLVLSVCLALSLFYLVWKYEPATAASILPAGQPLMHIIPASFTHNKRFSWANIRLAHPDTNVIPLPNTPQSRLGLPPQIQNSSQWRSDNEIVKNRQERETRLAAVGKAFAHTWTGYRNHAWLHDEITPISAVYKDPFGGWAATLVDSLDTLWIMGMRDEFDEALAAVEQIDFSQSLLDTISVFETTIRFLGGFLGAYDVSNGQYPLLKEKAIELGEMLYHAFDTPNHMPIARWDWASAKAGGGKSQVADSSMLIAELGSLTMEFTRLAQITGNDKYYSAVQRISLLLAEKQNSTVLPGLWPISVNARDQLFNTDSVFTWGGMADSAFEYLPKMHLLLFGQSPIYHDMWASAAAAAKTYLVFEPLLPSGTAATKDLKPLFLGTAHATVNDGNVKAPNVRLEAEGQHLTCFAGGAFALAARGLPTTGANSEATAAENLLIAERLTDGCIWSYRATPTGIGPELFKTPVCRKGRAAVSSGREADWEGTSTPNDCKWAKDDSKRAVSAGVPEGFSQVTDARYILRPEAIESVFVMYRVTGDKKWADAAWDMFSAITERSRTSSGFAVVQNVLVKNSGLVDSCESFWTAETLKYFYLIFSDPELVSLDEYVLNTEAHPFRWNHRG